MDDDSIDRKKATDAALKDIDAEYANFLRGVEEAEGKYRKAIQEIMKGINQRHVDTIKKSLGIQ